MDFDRSNDAIENLVALPVELHKSYHSVYAELSDRYPEMKMFRLDSGERGDFEHQAELFVELFNIYIKCLRWVWYRDHLRGILPNAYHLTYKERKSQCQS